VRWLRRHYGAGPLHLVGLLTCFAVVAYAMTRIFAQGGWHEILLWFLVCLIGHDLIGWPFYAAADRTLVRIQGGHDGGRRLLVPWVNHVRVPTVISGVLLAMFFPLVLRLSNSYYEASTGFSENVYLINWLVVSGILFAASAVVYVLRVQLARKRGVGGTQR